MAEKKKQRKQIAVLIGSAIVVGAIGYYYYYHYKTDPNESDTNQTPNPNKIEQITYAGDDMSLPTNKMSDDMKQYENKSEEDPDDAPIITDTIDDKPLCDENHEIKEASNNDIKQEEEPQQNNTQMDTIAVITEEKEPVNEQKEKESNSAKEESPVIVNKTDEESEPIVVKQINDNSISEIETETTDTMETMETMDVMETKEKENETIESKENENDLEMKALINKYDNIAQTVNKYKTLQYKNGKLTVRIINIVHVDKSEQDKNEVMIKLNISEQKEEVSSVKGNNGNMIEFNESFTLNVNDTLRDVLIVSVQNNEKEIGKLDINIIDIVGSKGECVENREFEVIGSKSECKIYLDLMYFESGLAQMDK